VKRNWIVIGVVAVVLVAMVWTSYRRRGPAGGAGLAPGKADGLVAPDFALTDLRTGKTVHLADFKGRAVLLNFWATWCPPCKVEIPWFVDLQDRYGSQGLTVVGVILLDDASAEKKLQFANDMKINYPVLLGTEQVGNAYGNIENLPTTFYIGRDGKVVKSVLGLRGRAEAERLVQQALAAGQQQAAR
jgi:thiol-disulfide isomerase/thioredoxin